MTRSSAARSLRPRLFAGLAATALSLSLAGAAFAQGGGPRDGAGLFGTDFESLDREARGHVTLDDLAALRAERAEAIDRDGDGVISRAELEAHFADRMGARIEVRAARAASALLSRMEGAGEDGIAVADFAAAARPMAQLGEAFARADLDGDGRLTRAEWEAASAARDARRAEMRAARAERREEMRSASPAERREMRREMRGEMRGGMHGKGGPRPGAE